MKAWLVLSIWLLLGLAVGLRRGGPPWERLLAVVFWPFFLVADSSSPLAAGDPLARLRRALGADEQAAPWLLHLERALAAHSARVRRLEEEVAGLLAERGGEAALVEARARSLETIEQALRRERESRAEAQARIEESATRLLLIHEGGRLEAVRPRLDELIGLLEARAEVDRAG
jgi:hypothetical protein